MTYRGRVQDGKIMLRDGVRLPEGAEVEVAITKAPLQGEPSPGGKPQEPKPGSIEEHIAAIWSDMPIEEWGRLPGDLSDQLDHYVYGTPRK